MLNLRSHIWDLILKHFSVTFIAFHFSRWVIQSGGETAVKAVPFNFGALTGNRN